MNHTLPDGWFNDQDILTYRMLAEQVPDGGTICELGVWMGRSLCSIADIIDRKNLKVVAIDTFEGSPCDIEMQEFAKVNDLQRTFIYNLLALGVELETHKMTTTEAVQFFEDKSFDLVFIDADHSYESVNEDIKNWLPKCKGTIAGHDYNTWEGVTRAVNEHFKKAEFFGAVWYVVLL